jgi:HJR/Mrr/RecB family endonuclease
MAVGDFGRGVGVLCEIIFEIAEKLIARTKTPLQITETNRDGEFDQKSAEKVTKTKETEQPKSLKLDKDLETDYQFNENDEELKLLSKKITKARQLDDDKARLKPTLPMEPIPKNNELVKTEKEIKKKTKSKKSKPVLPKGFNRTVKSNPVKKPIHSKLKTIPKKPDEFNLKVSNYLKFSGREAELLVGELFKRKGFSVEVTQPSHDGGIDVFAKKNRIMYGIQVKHWNAYVDVDDVETTLKSCVFKADKYILISGKSGFLRAAKDLAQKNASRFELWDKKRFKKELQENFPDFE